MKGKTSRIKRTVKAWVYENDKWSYRELTNIEVACCLKKTGYNEKEALK